MKILTIEDREDLRNLHRLAATSFGFEIHTASDGVKALELLDEISFDLVISDVAMPGHNIVEFIHELRSYDDSLHLPVMIYTDKKIPISWREHKVMDMYGVVTFFSKNDYTPRKLYEFILDRM